MKPIYLLSLLFLSLGFTACLVEENNLGGNDFDFELPNDPIDLNNLQRIDAAEIQGVQYGMATIEYSTNAGERTSFSMTSCLLSVIETQCDAECVARIEESGEALDFGNDIQIDPLDNDQNTISFAKFADNTSVPGSFTSEWLEAEVFPIVGGDYPFQVFKDGNNVVLSCTDCPVERNGITYDNRRLILRDF